jgi:serine/threonine protein phosphatase PrpC
VTQEPAESKNQNDENSKENAKEKAKIKSLTSQLMDDMRLVARERKQKLTDKTAPAAVEIPCQVGTIGEYRVGSVRREAKSTTIHVLPGDTIVIGSDGLFDNLTLAEIVAVVVKHQNLSSRQKAKALSDMAKAHGRKPDDITVAVGTITPVGSTKNANATEQSTRATTNNAGGSK